MQLRLGELGLGEVPTLLCGHARVPGRLGRRPVSAWRPHAGRGAAGHLGRTGFVPSAVPTAPALRAQAPKRVGWDSALGLGTGAGRIGGPRGTLSLLPAAGDLGRAGQTGLPLPLGRVNRSCSCPSTLTLTRSSVTPSSRPRPSTVCARSHVSPPRVSSREDVPDPPQPLSLLSLHSPSTGTSLFLRTLSSAQAGPCPGHGQLPPAQ